MPKENVRSGGPRPGYRLTPQEMDERRAKGLCYWCNARLTSQHNCSKRRSFVMKMMDEEEQGGEDDPGSEEVDGGEKGETFSCRCTRCGGLRLHRSCKSGERVRESLCGCSSTPEARETSSALACWTEFVASRLRYPPKAVEVANMQMLQCTHKCVDFTWEMQGASFSIEVYVIGLETYDLILGVHWLSTLGVISWDFATLRMVFEVQGVEV